MKKFILSLHSDSEKGQLNRLKSYINKSVPKISIPGNKKCNHFELIFYLKDNNYISKEHVKRWTNKESLDKAIEVLNSDFRKLFTIERRNIIEKVLKLRFDRLNNVL